MSELALKIIREAKEKRLTRLDPGNNALPVKGKPITEWENQDQAWAQLVRALGKLIV